MPSLSIIKYYRLFEVRLLHEFYLLSASNPTFFDLSAEARENILQSRINNNQYDLYKDLVIKPTLESQQKIKNYRWRFIPTQTGFLIVGEGVIQEGSTSVRSAFPIEDNLTLEFTIEAVNPLFKNFSNAVFPADLPSTYFFSNRGSLVSDLSFRTLSQNVKTFQNGNLYTVGGLADFGENDIRMATGNTSDSSQWVSIPGFGFVNENDKNLLPKAFYFQFGEGVGNTVAEFKLIDSFGRLLKSIIINKLSDQTSALLDFGEYLPTTVASRIETPDGWYTLEIDLGLSSIQRRVYLSDEYRKSHLGIIQIAFGNTAQGYEIVANDGALLTPTYEVHFLSRRTHFCYKPKARGKQFRVFNNSIANLFTNVEIWNSTTDKKYTELVTKVPQPLSALPIGVQNETGTRTILPSPDSTPLRMKKNSELLSGEPSGRLYSHIYTASVKDKFGY